MNPTELLTLTAGIFETAVSARPPKPSRVGAMESGPWYRDLPGTARFMPAIRRFCEEGGKVQIPALGAWGKAIGARGQDDGVRIDVQYSMFGEESRTGFTVPYPSDYPQVRTLFLGAPTRFGVGEVTLSADALLPTVRIEDDCPIIEFPKPHRCKVVVWEQAGFIRRLLGRMVESITDCEVRRFIFTPDYIDIQTSGAMNVMLPRLVPR